MFTTLKYRRQVAVLAALAMVASVLVAAPAVAADPMPDYKATFDACVGDAADSAGFEDVPAGHANAGDIDCIAYYGITRGTSATTYSPSMSVSREHMALFLTRLAGLVGIEVPSTPADAGFTDIGDLSVESQTAINRLADLGITRGTSVTAYSPADSVTRGQMALFIARLMNAMTPLTDGDPSRDDSVFYGYTPAEVVKNERITVLNQFGEEVRPEIRSPFTDLGAVSKNQYDAITQLYELGVASGISPVAYGPSALMTRALMAEFMAAMLDHSNARPGGVSIQADKTFAYGEYVTTVHVSVRTEEFVSVSDRLVDVFQNNCVDTCGDDAHFIVSGAEGPGQEPGQCNGKQTMGDCTWNTDDHQTDGNGNIFIGADIGATLDVVGDTSRTHTLYAWIGAEPGDVFDVDDDEYASVSASWTPARDSVAVSTSISDDAAGGTDRTTTGAPSDSGPQVHLVATPSVMITGKLVDSNGDDVKQGGVEVRIGWTRYVFHRGDNGVDASDTFAITYENSEEAIKTTNDDGLVTFTVRAPRDIKSATDQDVVDEVTFTVDADGVTGGIVNTTGSTTFNWVEDTRVYQKTTISATQYVLVDGDGDADDDGNISVTARLLDQYGAGIRVDENGNPYRITLTLSGTNGTDYQIDTDPDTTGIQATGAVTKTPSISSSSSRRGMARALFAVNQIARSTHGLNVNYQIADAEVNASGDLVDSDTTTPGVQPNYENLTDAAASGSTDPDTADSDIFGTYVYVEATEADGDNTQVTVHQLFGDDRHFATVGSGSDHGVLYTMDDNDTYIKLGNRPPPCQDFRPEVGNLVRVVVYFTDSDRESIFDITPTLN